MKFGTSGLHVQHTEQSGEKNYEAHDKEMFGHYASIGKLFTRDKEIVEIWTDHKNLEYFMMARKLNCQQARWSLGLADYSFALKHCPGQLNKKANILSRGKDHQEGVEVLGAYMHLTLDTSLIYFNNLFKSLKLLSKSSKYFKIFFLNFSVFLFSLV